MENKEANFYVEQQAEKQLGKSVGKMSLVEMDLVWVTFEESDTECSLVGRIHDEGVWYMIEDEGYMIEEGFDFQELKKTYFDLIRRKKLRKLLRE